MTFLISIIYKQIKSFSPISLGLRIKTPDHSFKSGGKQGIKLSFLFNYKLLRFILSAHIVSHLTLIKFQQRANHIPTDIGRYFQYSMGFWEWVTWWQEEMETRRFDFSLSLRDSQSLSWQSPKNIRATHWAARTSNHWKLPNAHYLLPIHPLIPYVIQLAGAGFLQGCQQILRLGDSPQVVFVVVLDGGHQGV